MSEQAAAKDQSTVLQILNSEGVTGLYAGLSSSLVGIGITNVSRSLSPACSSISLTRANLFGFQAVYYGAYSLASEGARKASPTGTTLTVKQSILAGLIAGEPLLLIVDCAHLT